MKLFTRDLIIFSFFFAIIVFPITSSATVINNLNDCNLPAGVPIPVGKCINGSNGVTVIEDTSSKDGTLYYNVYNDSNVDISYFMISSFIIDEPLIKRSFWVYLLTTASTWLSDLAHLEAADPLFDSSNLGSYESYFGIDPVAYLFRTQTPEFEIKGHTNSIQEFGHLNALPSSEFVALTKDGTIISQSALIESVPEPSVIALMGLGLLSMFRVNRRKV